MTVYFDKVRSRWRYDFVLGGVRHVGPCVHHATQQKAADVGAAREIEALIRSKIPAPAARRRNVMTAMGWIYFVATADGRHVKIGWTKKLRSRMADLQVANHQDLKILGKRRGTMEDEFAIHRSLRDHNVRGEWFALSPMVSAVIDRETGHQRAMGNLQRVGLLRHEVPPGVPPELSDGIGR